jgi:hypothetical protein
MLVAGMRIDLVACRQKDRGGMALLETLFNRLSDADAEVILIAETTNKIAIANLVKRAGTGHTCSLEDFLPINHQLRLLTKFSRRNT